MRFAPAVDQQRERIDALIGKQNQSIQDTQRQIDAIYE